MADSDIRIQEARPSFSDEKFRTPFKLSTGDISEITYAHVEVTVENRRGQTAKGVGGILLSDLWAFPTPLLSHLEKDRIMRELVIKMANELLQIDGFHDPLQISHLMEQINSELLVKMQAERRDGEEITKLAGLVCWSPIDAAVHDAWGKAMGCSSYEMYTREYLNCDLEHYLGNGWRNRYPGEFLSPPRERLWVQHVVGASDPLTPAEAGRDGSPNDGLPDALSEWIARDGVRWFKLKVKGTDVSWNLQRILDVYQVAVESLKGAGINEPVFYEIDPNEACPDPEPMIELLRKLREADAAAYDALIYIEQPTSRRLADYNYTLHGISKYKPVLMDESLEDLENLQHIERLGWNGVALKTCKGQSHALITYCWARQKGLFITMQDLTNPGLSLVHSANLCSHLSLSTDTFEYNSRQYAPYSRAEERGQYQELFRVRNGAIGMGQLRHVGLY